MTGLTPGSDGRFELNTGPCIRTGCATSVNNAGGQVGVDVESPTENDIGARRNVTCAGDQPKVGDRGLLLFESESMGSKGYWIGTINTRYDKTDDQDDPDSGDDPEEPTFPPGAKGLFNDAGSCGITASDSDISMVAGSMNVIVADGSFRVAKQGLSMQLEPSGFLVKIPDGTEERTTFSLKNSSVELLSGGAFTLRTNTNVNFEIPGSFFITGQTVDGEETSMDLFKVKCNRALLDTGSGPLNVSGSALSVKIGSSKLGNPVPGLGSMTSVALEVVQGNMDISVGIGDIDIRSLSPTSAIKIVNGLLAIGPQSWVEFDTMSAIIGAEMVPGMGATLELTRTGSADLTAFMDIAVTSDMGAIDISTMAGDISIETIMGKVALTAMTEMSLDALKILITASAKVAVEAAMLDLTGASLINFGPKTAVPGPTGPLNSIPICPLLGCPHSGEKCA